MIHINALINDINQWLEQEKSLGSPNPNNIVLATADKTGVPHSRIVAIREISTQGILFFTQRGTRKVQEIMDNPQVCMTLWLPLQQRQIIFEGSAKALNQDENESYWNLLPYDRKLRFSAYSPTSSNPIHALSDLEEKVKSLSAEYSPETIPISPYYCGFRVTLKVIYFYTLGTTTFSEVIKYTLENDIWNKQLLSP